MLKYNSQKDETTGKIQASLFSPSSMLASLGIDKMPFPTFYCSCSFLKNHVKYFAVVTIPNCKSFLTCLFCNRAFILTISDQNEFFSHARSLKGKKGLKNL